MGVHISTRELTGVHISSCEHVGDDGMDEEVFAYRTNKEGKVFISWHGKQVMILKGPNAKKFLAQIELLADHEAQIVMAKLTGNFKRGNEKREWRE